MAIPPLFYVAWLAQLFPAVCALRHGWRLPEGRRWIVVYALVGFSLDLVALYFNRRGINNHWVSYLAAPLEVSTVLLALASWQPGVLGRRILRFSATAFVVTAIMLMAFVENLTTFSLLRGPIESILIVAASLTTLLLLIRLEQGNLLQRDWFWICAGLTLRYGAGVALGPLARILVGDSPDVVISVLEVKGVVNIVSMLLIARGIWCPILPQLFSGPSSPVSLPSLSSSSPSAPGW